MFLPDGFKTVVAFSLLPGILLREREVHPPELDGGGPIDTTTMLNGAAVGAGPGIAGSGNVGMRTQTPKSLTTVGKLTLTVSYDPFLYSSLFTNLNAVQTITILFPDGATMAFLGWINKFTPAPLKEGEFPLAEVEIFPTNTSSVPVAATARNDVNPTFVAGANVGLVVR